MIARLIIFDREGKKVAHQLSLHHKLSNTFELKLVMGTSTERFEAWLFFFLRDHGGIESSSGGGRDFESGSVRVNDQ